MFFAHGPVGYTVAVIVKRFFKGLNLSRNRLLWLLGGSFLAGISPDFDLFYYYLADVEGSHREFVTHAPVASVGVTILLALILFVFLKKREIYHKLLWLSLTLAHFSHILADSLGNGVRWMYPDSLLYGLALAHPFFDKNFFVINFGLEFVIIAFFLFHVGRYVVRSQTWRRLLYVAAVLAFVCGEALVIGIHLNSFQTSGMVYHGDIDGDHVSNVRDTDVDGDGIPNVMDADANGNGLTNEEDALAALDDMTGVWHDPLNGSFLNMFTRLGFFLHSDVVHRAYDRAGIFFLTEIGEDSKIREDHDYVGNLADAKDVRIAANLFEFFKSRDLLVESTESSEPGDLAFIDNGRMVGVVSEHAPDSGFGDHGPGEPSITMVVPTEEVMPYTQEKIESSIGEITHWGRLSLGYE